MTPAGIEPKTLRFVAQRLNSCATAVPKTNDTDRKYNKSTFSCCHCDIIITPTCFSSRPPYSGSLTPSQTRLCFILIAVFYRHKLYHNASVCGDCCGSPMMSVDCRNVVVVGRLQIINVVFQKKLRDCLSTCVVFGISCPDTLTEVFFLGKFEKLRKGFIGLLDSS